MVSSPQESQSDALSVSAAVALTKALLQEHTFKILGEVSELNDKPGYKAVYFTVKDDKASLPCLMWMNRYRGCGTRLQIGAKVEITGKFTIFAPKGRMNFDVSSLTLAGDGDLRRKVAQLALRLKDEGLMDPARKAPIPSYPDTIGLVTSPRGAAVHDVLRTLRRRYPCARILFAGVPVEGKRAHEDLIEGLETVIAAGAQEVLLVRGGGSFEDLMPFNEEALARAIAASPVPIITGIGHEPDTSIADMVADLRASTPTAAAEAVSPHIHDIFESLDSLCARMTSTLSNRLNRSEVFLDNLASRPVFKDSSVLFATDSQMLDLLHVRLDHEVRGFARQHATALDALKGRLDQAIPQALEKRKREVALGAAALQTHGSHLFDTPSYRMMLMTNSLRRIGENLLVSPKTQASLAASRLNDLSPLHILERGWSITKDESGSIVKSVSQVKTHDLLHISVRDGSIACRVEDRGAREYTEIVSLEDVND